MSRRSTYQERYDSQGYFAPGDVLGASASGTETTSNEVIDGSPGAAKRINAKPYEPVDYSKNPYENSNNEYLKPVTPGNAEPTVVKRKSGPTKPGGKKGGNSGGSGAGGGGGNCPCAEEKKKQTQTGAQIGAKAAQAGNTAAGGGGTASTGGSNTNSSAGSTSASTNGNCDCEHNDSVIPPVNKVINAPADQERETYLNPCQDIKGSSETIEFFYTFQKEVGKENLKSAVDKLIKFFNYDKFISYYPNSPERSGMTYRIDSGPAQKHFATSSGTATKPFLHLTNSTVLRAAENFDNFLEFVLVIGHEWIHGWEQAILKLDGSDRKLLSDREGLTKKQRDHIAHMEREVIAYYFSIAPNDFFMNMPSRYRIPILCIIFTELSNNNASKIAWVVNFYEFYNNLPNDLKLKYTFIRQAIDFVRYNMRIDEKGNKT